MIRHNWKYKILALICALGLQRMYGRAEVTPLTHATVRVPVRALSKPESLELTLTPQVTVTLKGPKSAVDAVLEGSEAGASQVDATVNLTGRGAGAHTLPVELRVKTPLQEASGKPHFVSVVLEPVIEKSLPVDVVPMGRVPRGFRWDSTSVDPEQATVEGPRSLVEKVARLEVRVPVQGATGDVHRPAEIQALDSRDEPVDAVRVFPNGVQVHVRIARVLQYKVVPIVLQTMGQPAPGFHVANTLVEPMTVTVSGSAHELDGVQALTTEPVDLTGGMAPIVRTVRLRAPQGIEPVQMPTVRVKVFFASEIAETP